MSSLQQFTISNDSFATSKYAKFPASGVSRDFFNYFRIKQFEHH